MAPSDQARFEPASDQSLLVYLADEISPAANQRVLKLLRLLESQPIDGVRNLHPAYASLLIVFDPLRLEHAQLERMLRQHLANLQDVALPKPRVVEIPVCYGGDYGPDLPEVANLHGLTPQQVIDLHVSATYLVYFLGFAPGFAYLGGLPDALATPRLAMPRKRVPAGTVAIAGSQTGVYPFATPGGWRLIGRTPALMFGSDRTPMNLLSIGDRVRFAPISPEEFAHRAAR